MLRQTELLKYGVIKGQRLKVKGLRLKLLAFNS
jgi:hypothetical protein